MIRPATNLAGGLPLRPGRASRGVVSLPISKSASAPWRRTCSGGNVDKGDAAVYSQLYNVQLQAIGMELKVKELEEMEKALERQGEEADYGSAG